MIDDFTGTKEAAQYLGLTRRRVAGLCASGELIGAKLMGKTWLIPKQSVEVYHILHPNNRKRGLDVSERTKIKGDCSPIKGKCSP